MHKLHRGFANDQQGRATQSHQALTQLKALGYQEGDRVYLRLLVPKKVPQDWLLQNRYGYFDERGHFRRYTIEGYLKLSSHPSFTRVYGDGREKSWTDGWGILKYWNRKGYGVYFVVNPGGTDDCDIEQCPTLFWENDAISKAEQSQKADWLANKADKPASLIIETYKSLHCYLRLEQPIAPTAWERWQERLIQLMESDQSIRNPSRLMRLSGFDHVRWETDRFEFFPVQIKQQSASIWSTEELDDYLPEHDSERWEKKSKKSRAAKNGVAAVVSSPADNPWDIRNFAEYLTGYNPGGREGWITCKCPAHNGESDDSLHINESTGQFICHGGCDSRSVYRAAFEQAESAGYRIPESFDQAEYDQIIAWQEEQERCDQAEAEHRDDLSFISQILGFKSKKRKRRQRVESIKSTVPVIEFDQPEQQNDLIRELSQTYKYILVQSGTGAGKSYQSGLLDPEGLDVNTLVYLTQQSRNPSTATVEGNFVEMAIRHQGMTGTGKFTPLNNEVMRPVPFDRAVRNDGNCVNAAEFVKAKAKGYDVGDEAKSNPICQSCPFNIPRQGEDVPVCAAHHGPGYGFRKERREAFQSDRIRMNPNSAPAKFDGNTALIWEEAGALLTSETLEATVDELSAEWGDLTLSNESAAEILKPVWKTIRAALDNKTRYGISTVELKARFNKIENAAELLEELRPVMKRDLSELFGGKPKEESLAARAKRAKSEFEGTFKKAARLNERIQNLESKSGKRTAKQTLKIQSEKAKLAALKQRLDGARIAHFATADQYKAQKQERKQKPDVDQILQIAKSQKLWDLFAVLLSVEPGSVQVNYGKATITRPNQRVSRLADSAKVNIFLDATELPEVLAARLGIDPSEIAVIKLKQEPARNLHHIQVSGFGKCSRDRAESTNERLKKLHEGIRADAARRLGLNPENIAIEIADHKGVNAFDARIRHMSNSRGSNEIAGAQVLVQHGVPKPNLGAVQADHETMVNPSFTFEQYYQHCCDAEFWQESDRVRSKRYPDRQFLNYVVTEEVLPTDAEQVDAGDLSVEAARPGEQVWRRAKQLALKALNETGILPKIEELAEQLQITQGHLSKVFNRFEGGWKAFKKAVLALIRPPEPDDQPLTCEEEIAVALVEEIAAGESPEQVAADLAAISEPLGWQSWSRICSRLDREVRGLILDRLFGWQYFFDGGVWEVV